MTEFISRTAMSVKQSKAHFRLNLGSKCVLV